MTPSPGQVSFPNSFVPLFIFYILSHLLSKRMGCLSGCLVSSTSIQKLFCGICSAFKLSFNEFVGEKVVSLSYSSTILAASCIFKRSHEARGQRLLSLRNLQTVSKYYVFRSKLINKFISVMFNCQEISIFLVTKCLKNILSKVILSWRLLQLKNSCYIPFGKFSVFV